MHWRSRATASTSACRWRRCAGRSARATACASPSCPAAPRCNVRTRRPGMPSRAHAAAVMARWYARSRAGARCSRAWWRWSRCWRACTSGAFRPRRAALGVIPASVDDAVGEVALRSIDEEWMKPSALDAAQQQRLRAAFEQVLAAQPPGSVPAHRLEFRKSRIGPNAFALPGGTIVMTDELVTLVDGDAAVIAGVLAHELGHVRHRDGMRMLIQASAVGVLASVVVGDFNSLLATVPVVLGQSAYSRDAERRADAESVRLLRDAGLSPAVMVTFFEKIAKEQGEHRLGIAIASHPADEERIRFFREAAAQRQR
ncbi:M48 family metallopeptidase [Piscinibacter aquaticus]|uniref:M48 family metallopeptidase n=1 Tax=Piscinibacter aquaticus TaxID=392597 RepID=A0A5C6U254_9BURK|nr:M48 family metallopeptidase [Piscinibacter aquaticus]